MKNHKREAGTDVRKHMLKKGIHACKEKEFAKLLFCYTNNSIEYLINILSVFHTRKGRA